MNDLKLNWHANIVNAKKEPNWEPGAGSLAISGELVNADVCANNFALDANELPQVSEQVKNINLRLDHSKSARDVIGGFKLGTYDPEHKRIMFEAEVDDPAIQRSIMKGRLKYVSIGASADAFCSKCDKPTKPFKTCKCTNSHDVIRNIKLKEASIVTEPAYANSEFSPVGFAASVSSALAENTVTPNSSKEDKAVLSENIKLEEKRMTEDIKATTLSPAGTDAIIVLGKKLEEVLARFEKLENTIKKEEEARIKKEEKAEATKLDSIMSSLTKLEEEFKKKKDEDEKMKKETSVGLPKDIPKSKFEETEPEEEDEEEEKPVEEKAKKKKEKPTEPEEDEKMKKEEAPAKKSVQGAKVESADGNTVITADSVPAWYSEIKAFAQKEGILD